MTKRSRIAILGLALAVFIAAFVLKETNRNAGGKPSAEAVGSTALPRLLDLGANQCIPCKMMAPILEELKREYEGRMIVEVIDVRKNRSAGVDYGIKVIPTQIFFTPAGEEVFRHEGFMSKEDILAKWDELEIDVEAGGPSKR